MDDAAAAVVELDGHAVGHVVRAQRGTLVARQSARMCGATGDEMSPGVVQPGRLARRLCAQTHGVIITAALWNTAGHYIFVLWFLSMFFFFLTYIHTYIIKVTSAQSYKKQSDCALQKSTHVQIN